MFFPQSGISFLVFLSNLSLAYCTKKPEIDILQVRRTSSKDDVRSLISNRFGMANHHMFTTVQRGGGPVVQSSTRTTQ